MKKFLYHTIELLAAFIFFLSCMILVFQVPLSFNSPDENANASFTESFINKTSLRIDEPLNLDYYGLFGPRSVVAVQESLVPGSFIGLPVIFGTVGKVLGMQFVLVLTPILMILAAYAFKDLILRIFSSRSVARISFFLLLFHPAIWYYSARTMMHNVGFVALLILAFWIYIARPLSWKDKIPLTSRRALESLCAGFLLALAIAFRSSEVIWVAALCIGLILTYWKHVRASITFVIIGGLIPLLGLLFLHNGLYGSPLATGYAPAITYESSIVADVISADEIVEDEGLSSSIIFPFGIDVKDTLKHVWYYALYLYPWLSIGAFLGLIGLFITKRLKEKPIAVYSVTTILLGIYLFLLYGSWRFTDNPDPNIVTIGTSYVRYWIPVFILLTPFLAHLIVQLSCSIKRKMFRGFIRIFSLFCLISLSIFPVFFANDGLAHLRQNIFLFAEQRDTILAVTEDDSTIIVDRADKFLWPDRRVVHPLREDATYAAMPDLVQDASLYYFGITFPETDLDYLNSRKLGEMNLQIAPILTIGQETLYRISEL